MSEKSLLLFDEKKELQAVVEDLDPELGDLSGRYRVMVSSPEFLVLRRSEGLTRDRANERVLMAGQIVSESTILEIVNLIASSRWVGSLHVYGVDAHRILGFYNGALRHAQSDHPEDRLDKVLRRIGVLSPAQVESVMRSIRPGQRFGELLVERGLVERSQLFSFLGKQMEQVMLAAVLDGEGNYVFTVHDEPESAPSATNHIPLQRLLLDAAERVDKLAVFRKLVPDPELCPVPQPGVEVTGLDPRERLVLGHSTGEKSVREIGSETWLGKFETTEAVYDLVRRGQVTLRRRSRTPEELAASLLRPFNRSLKEIYRAVEGNGQASRIQGELRKWVKENPDGEVLGGSLHDEGLIDTETIAATLRESSSRHRIAELQSILHELTSFALFTASLWLPRSQELELSRRVNQRLEAIRE